jgi:phage-related protein
VGAAFRIFYVTLKNNILILLHGYQKQSRKAPKKEIAIATQRMIEVLNNEKDYT